jgi:hypothetical protein
MSIRTELLALKDSDGKIVPEVALNWARRHTRSALYKAINWDDAYNIRNYLLVQVRNLITLNIRSETRDPEMISLSIDRSERDGGGYREISDVLSAPRLRQIMLMDALHEFELLKKRFDELDELADVWQVVETVARRATARPPARRRGGRIEPRPAA